MNAAKAPEVPAQLPSPWLTKREAAARSKLSIVTITRAVLSGELRASGGGRGSTVLIHIDDLDEWIRNR